MSTSGKRGGFHKLAPDPEETPRGEDVEPDDGRRSGDDDGDSHDATGPAHGAGTESGGAEQR